MYYAYSCLCGKASQYILPWLTAKQDQHALVQWEEFVQAMDKAFGDPNHQRKALIQVNTMKQGWKSLEEFLNEFDGELLSAGGMLWSNAQKKTLVKTAVNWQLLQGMIGMEQASSYKAYCDQLRRVNHDLQRVEHLSKRNRPTTTPYHQPSLYRGDSEQMDWEPITAQLAAVNKQQNTSHTTTRGP